VSARAGGTAALLDRLLELDGELRLLLAHAAPELDALEGDLVVGRLHGGDGDGEEGGPHVRLHELVVDVHDLDQVLQRGHLDLVVVGLGGLANDLHDVVALRLLGEVAARELERVEQGVAGGEAHVVARLFFAHAVDDGGQDLVALGLQDLWVLDGSRELNLKPKILMILSIFKRIVKRDNLICLLDLFLVTIAY